MSEKRMKTKIKNKTSLDSNWETSTLKLTKDRHIHILSRKKKNKPKIYGWKSNKVYTNTTDCYDELSQCKRTSWSELISTVGPHQYVFVSSSLVSVVSIEWCERASAQEFKMHNRPPHIRGVYFKIDCGASCIQHAYIQIWREKIKNRVLRSHSHIIPSSHSLQLGNLRWFLYLRKILVFHFFVVRRCVLLWFVFAFFALFPQRTPLFAAEILFFFLVNFSF